MSGDQSGRTTKENVPSNTSELLLDPELQEVFEECEEEIASFGKHSSSFSSSSSSPVSSGLVDKMDTCLAETFTASSVSLMGSHSNGNVPEQPTCAAFSTDEATFSFRDYILGKKPPVNIGMENCKELERHEENVGKETNKLRTEMIADAEKSQKQLKNESVLDSQIKMGADTTKNIEKQEFPKLSSINYEDSLNALDVNKETDSDVADSQEEPQRAANTQTMITNRILKSETSQTTTGPSAENGKNFDTDVGIILKSERSQVVTPTLAQIQANLDHKTKEDSQTECLDIFASHPDLVLDQAHLTLPGAASAPTLDHLQDIALADGPCKSISEHQPVCQYLPGQVICVSGASAIINIADSGSANVTKVNEGIKADTLMREEVDSLSQSDAREEKKKDSVFAKAVTSCADFMLPLTPTIQKMIQYQEAGKDHIRDAQDTVEKETCELQEKDQCVSSEEREREIIAVDGQENVLISTNINSSFAKEVEEKESSCEVGCSAVIPHNSEESEIKGGGLNAEGSLGTDAYYAAEENETSTVSIEDGSVIIASLPALRDSLSAVRDRRDGNQISTETAVRKGGGRTEASQEDVNKKETVGVRTLFHQVFYEGGESLTENQIQPVYDSVVTQVVTEQKNKDVVTVGTDETALHPLSSSSANDCSSINPSPPVLIPDPTDTEGKTPLQEEEACVNESAPAEKLPSSDISYLSAASADDKDPTEQISSQQVQRTRNQQDNADTEKETNQGTEDQHQSFSLGMSVMDKTCKDGTPGDMSTRLARFASLPPITVHENLRHPVSESFYAHGVFNNRKPDHLHQSDRSHDGTGESAINDNIKASNSTGRQNHANDNIEKLSPPSNKIPNITEEDTREIEDKQAKDENEIILQSNQNDISLEGTNTKTTLLQETGHVIHKISDPIKSDAEKHTKDLVTAKSEKCDMTASDKNEEKCQVSSVCSQLTNNTDVSQQEQTPSMEYPQIQHTDHLTELKYQTVSDLNDGTKDPPPAPLSFPLHNSQSDAKAFIALKPPGPMLSHCEVNNDNVFVPGEELSCSSESNCVSTRNSGSHVEAGFRNDIDEKLDEHSKSHETKADKKETDDVSSHVHVLTQEKEAIIATSINDEVAATENKAGCLGLDQNPQDTKPDMAAIEASLVPDTTNDVTKANTLQEDEANTECVVLNSYQFDEFLDKCEVLTKTNVPAEVKLDLLVENASSESASSFLAATNTPMSEKYCSAELHSALLQDKEPNTNLLSTQNTRGFTINTAVMEIITEEHPKEENQMEYDKQHKEQNFEEGGDQLMENSISLNINVLDEKTNDVQSVDNSVLKKEDVQKERNINNKELLDDLLTKDVKTSDGASTEASTSLESVVQAESFKRDHTQHQRVLFELNVVPGVNNNPEVECTDASKPLTDCLEGKNRGGAEDANCIDIDTLGSVTVHGTSISNTGDDVCLDGNECKNTSSDFGTISPIVVQHPVECANVVNQKVDHQLTKLSEEIHEQIELHASVIRESKGSENNCSDLTSQPPVNDDKAESAMKATPDVINLTADLVVNDSFKSLENSTISRHGQKCKDQCNSTAAFDDNNDNNTPHNQVQQESKVLSILTAHVENTEIKPVNNESKSQGNNTEPQSCVDEPKPDVCDVVDVTLNELLKPLENCNTSHEHEQKTEVEQETHRLSEFPTSVTKTSQEVEEFLDRTSESVSVNKLQELQQFKEAELDTSELNKIEDDFSTLHDVQSEQTDVLSVGNKTDRGKNWEGSAFLLESPMSVIKDLQESKSKLLNRISELQISMENSGESSDVMSHLSETVDLDKSHLSKPADDSSPVDNKQKTEDDSLNVVAFPLFPSVNRDSTVEPNTQKEQIKKYEQEKEVPGTLNTSLGDPEMKSELTDLPMFSISSLQESASKNLDCTSKSQANVNEPEHQQKATATTDSQPTTDQKRIDTQEKKIPELTTSHFENTDLRLMKVSSTTFQETQENDKLQDGTSEPQWTITDLGKTEDIATNQSSDPIETFSISQEEQKILNNCASAVIFGNSKCPGESSSNNVDQRKKDREEWNSLGCPPVEFSLFDTTELKPELQVSQEMESKHLNSTPQSHVTVNSPEGQEEAFSDLCKSVKLTTNDSPESLGNSNTLLHVDKTEDQCFNIVTCEDSRCVEVFDCKLESSKQVNQNKIGTTQVNQNNQENESPDITTLFENKQDNPELRESTISANLSNGSRRKLGDCTIDLQDNVAQNDSSKPCVNSTLCLSTFGTKCQHKASSTNDNQPSIITPPCPNFVLSNKPKSAPQDSDDAKLTHSCHTLLEPSHVQNKECQDAAHPESQPTEVPELIASMEIKVEEAKNAMPETVFSLEANQTALKQDEINEWKEKKREDDVVKRRKLVKMPESCENELDVDKGIVKAFFSTIEKTETNNTDILASSDSCGLKSEKKQDVSLTCTDTKTESSSADIESSIHVMCESVSDVLKTDSENNLNSTNGEINYKVEQEENFGGNENTGPICTNEEQVVAVTCVLRSKEVSETPSKAHDLVKQENPKPERPATERSCESSDWIKALREAATVSIGSTEDRYRLH